MKLDVWDVVALNAFCEWDYYIKEYDRQHHARRRHRLTCSGALQRLCGHGKLHARMAKLSLPTMTGPITWKERAGPSFLISCPRAANAS